MKQIELKVMEGLVVDAFLYEEIKDIAIAQGRVVTVSLIEDNLYNLNEVLYDIVSKQ